MEENLGTEADVHVKQGVRLIFGRFTVLGLFCYRFTTVSEFQTQLNEHASLKLSAIIYTQPHGGVVAKKLFQVYIYVHQLFSLNIGEL